MTKIARVFPRRTNATPCDDLAFVGPPPLWEVPCDVVHVSCAFTWDRPIAEQLRLEWARAGYNTKVGGPAYGYAGGNFVPGRYVAPGYVMTSRGCNNRCWFCYVWKREGSIRELHIVDGWNVLDSNLLQCSEQHIRAVFAMLKRQKRRAEFTGGLEAKRLQDWHIDLLADLKPKQVFFAYDTPDDYEPLVIAVHKMTEAGFGKKSHSLRCYVLIGYPKDTLGKAESRLRETLKLGLTPMAMLYRDDNGTVNDDWRKFQRIWARPALIHSRLP